MKNIVIVDEKIPYLLNKVNHQVGGASVQTQNWIHGFDKMGYNSIIYSPVVLQNNSSYTIELSPIIKGFRNPFSLMNVCYKFYKVLKKYKPEFIYISTPFWSNIAYVLPAKLLNIRTVQRVSNDNLVLKGAKLKFSKLKYKLYLMSLNNSSLILCQNEYQEENFKTDFANKPVYMLHNPFLYKKYSYIEERKYIAWIGLFQPQKNLPALFEIAKELPEIEFRIAGKAHDVPGKPNGIVDDETNIALNNLKKLKNVVFMGLVPREEVSNFLAEAYCLLNTSNHEGFSNTYLEALSVNTPVVTRSATDPDGIIKKNNLGLIADEYYQLPKLLKEITRLDHGERRILSKYVKNNHSPIVQAEKLLKYINY